MPESLNISQPAWTLLDLLQQQLGVSFEVLDLSLRPVMPVGGSESASLVEQPGVAEETRRALRTGEARVDTSRTPPVGVFPLRAARQVIGCLLVIRRGARARAEPPAERTLDGAGHLARTALESDLALNAQLSDANYRTRRLHGILRFLGQLGTPEGERDVMNAVVQAATVWFDLDCRIYQRHPDGAYRLAASLPGAEHRGSIGRLEAARVEKLLAARRISSSGDLEDLGFGGRRDEVIVQPVGTPPDWLLLLAGTIEPEVELTFAAIARVLAGELQARAVERTDAWQDRLAGTASETGRGPQRVLLGLLGALAEQVGATGVRATLVTGESERTLAARGRGAVADLKASGTERPQEDEQGVTHTIQIGPDSFVRVTLWGALEANRAAALEMRSWAKALRPWLREAVAGVSAAGAASPLEAAASPFEGRIQEEVERAKRFNLGLGLVVIVAEDGPLAETGLENLLASVRPELRASDLLGRLRGGRVALVLVHSGREGAESVIGRLRRRFSALGEDVPLASVQLGQAVFSAECATADKLIALALRQARSLQLRN